MGDKIKEKSFELDSLNLVEILGYQDKNIKPLEERFAASITVRGNSVFVKGEETEINAIENIFREMIYVFNTSGELTPEDVATIIDLELQGKQILPREELNNIVLYTKKDVIRARTPNQVKYLKAIQNNDICFAIGPAGTGKTYLAVAFAVSALKKGLVKKIVLTRPAVEAGESLGFLPGDFREKVDPYLRPLYDALQDMVPFEQLRAYIERDIVEIVPLAYMRGRTLNNAYVILDEAQNTTGLQMKMFLTRLGPNSKAIITGDITQIDLPSKTRSGLVEVKEILKGVDGVAFVYFDKKDVVRHKLVKDIINAYEEYRNGESPKE
jgi:phosphate starvation-inducible PhoH-like protein